MSGRLEWFEHLEHKREDWVLAFRNMEVVGAKCRSRGRKMRRKCVSDDMELVGLQSVLAIFIDVWRDSIWRRKSDHSLVSLSFPIA